MSEPAPAPTFVSYEDFGRQFFQVAVTEERVLAGINVLAGEPIDFGPIGVGPGRVAKVRATGQIGQATSTRVAGDLVRLDVVLPVDLEFTVDLQVDTHRFDARLSIPLELTARAVDGCCVFIEATPPRADQVTVDLHANGLRASILQRVAGVDAEVRRFVAKYVAREVEKPAILRARTIDVAAAIDTAWSGVGLKSENATEIADDFAQAAEGELRDVDTDG